MRRPSSRQRRLIILTLALVVFAIAYFGGARYQRTNRILPQISGVLIQPPSPLPDMSEMGPQMPLTPALLQDHWSLLTFDPIKAEMRSQALVRLLQIHNRLADRPELQNQIHFLYLPLAADASTLAAISALHENIKGLDIQTEQAREIFNRFGVDLENKQAVFYLINPETNLHALFTPDQDAANIAKDINTLINPGR